MQRLSEDLAIHIVGVFIIKWWQASQHLIQQYTERPPIDSLGIASTRQELRSEVLWCSTER